MSKPAVEQWGSLQLQLNLTQNPDLKEIQRFPLTVVQTKKIKKTNLEIKPLCLPN